MGPNFLCGFIFGIKNCQELADAQPYRENALRMFRTLALCLSILLSNHAFADVRFRLLFDGAPFVPKSVPDFACLDDAKQQWFDCGLTKTGVHGECRRKNLAPGSYEYRGQ
jgi:hypothetical protein